MRIRQMMKTLPKFLNKAFGFDATWMISVFRYAGSPQGPSMKKAVVGIDIFDVPNV
jgi:hypothetical protein